VKSFNPENPEYWNNDALSISDMKKSMSNPMINIINNFREKLISPI
jgi:hypothetical protein